MIQNIVGPPMQGLPGFVPKEKGAEAKGEKSDSFDKALEERMSSQSFKKGTGAENQKPQKVQTNSQANEPEKKSRTEVPKKEADVTEARVTPRTMGPLSKKAASEREKAIQKFMDSFESEFGIPSMRIVEAMASLDTSQIQQSPEQTADAVISQLDLSDQEKEKAAAMYAGLLESLNQVEATKTPKLIVPTNEQMMTAPRMQERSQSVLERKSAINNSLDQMNQKFWMTQAKAQDPAMIPKEQIFDQQVVAEQRLGANMELASPGLSEKLMNNVNEQQVLPPVNGQNQDLQKLVSELKEAAHRRGQNIEISPELIESLSRQQSGSDVKLNSLGKGMNLAAKAQGEGDASVAQMAYQQTAQGATQRDQADAFSQNSDGASSGEKDANSGKAQTKGEFSQALKGRGEAINLDAIQLQKDLQMPTTSAANAAPAFVKMTPENHEANVREIMNQAQYLIKNGGGEMKVEMSPEGLGKIHLKVMMENGKVNLEMAADSHEAKKMIESSLSDLKSSLAAHKLSVDHVKVDVVAGTNTDNNTRSDMNMNPNAQRDTTKQFWNQFQESFGNRGQRDGFYDVPALKGYQTRRDPLQPIEGESVKTRSQGKDKGRGIDLVA